MPPPRAPRVSVRCKRFWYGCCENDRRLAWRRFRQANRRWLRQDAGAGDG